MPIATPASIVQLAIPTAIVLPLTTFDIAVGLTPHTMSRSEVQPTWVSSSTPAIIVRMAHPPCVVLVVAPTNATESHAAASRIERYAVTPSSSFTVCLPVLEREEDTEQEHDPHDRRDNFQEGWPG